MATLVLAWAMISVVRPDEVPPMNIGWLEIVFVTIRETLVGLLLGFTSRFIIFSTQMAGQWISAEMGLQSGQMLSPGTGETSNETGVVLEFLAMLVLFTFQLHHGWLKAFAETYRILPIVASSSSGNEGLLILFGKLVSGGFVVSVKLAMPVIAGGFLLNVTLLLLGRALPQLPVFQDSFLFRAVVGLFLFGASLHLIASHLNSRAERIPDDVTATVRMLRTSLP